MALVRACLALALLAGAIPAEAQLFRTYLSANGNDANACTLPAPCRLLPAALNAVADGGEVWMLDSANYNTATVFVTKSVTILAVPGAVGSLVGTSDSVLRMDTPNTKVTLRNLVMRPLPGASSDLGAIRANAVARLAIEATLISGFPNAGVTIGGPAIVRIVDSTIRDSALAGLFLSTGAKVTVVESRILDNGAAGIFVLGATAGATTVQVSRCTVSGNGGGGVVASDMSAATDVARLTIEGSTIVRNANAGLQAYGNFGGTSLLTAAGNLIAHNTGPGISAQATGARAVAGGNTVTGNFSGLNGVTGGTVETYGDNQVHDNNANTNGSIVTITKG